MNKTLLSLSVALVACVTVVSAHAQGIKGDAKAGENKNAMCIGCHGIPGYQASFPEIHKVPKITGQSESYIAAALNAYKTGERKHPSMRGISESLTDQDIADLAAFYSASAGPVVDKAAPAASGKVAELITKANCASCHGANFSSPIAPGYPKVAGQYADYLYVALKAYKTKGNPQVGRNNAIMGAAIQGMSNSELKELANYMAHLPGEMLTVPESRFRKAP